MAKFCENTAEADVFTYIFCIIDVKPNHVHRNVVLVEISRYFEHIFLVEVIPSTLVMTNGKSLRHSSVTSKLPVLLKDLLIARTKEYKEVQDARLRKPVGVRAGRRFGNVNTVLAGRQREHSNRASSLMGVHQRD